MVWKEMLALLLVICFIALGNLCYGNFIGISHFNLQELSLALAATFLLAVFPITANLALKYNRFVALNQKDAELMEAEVLDFQHRTAIETPVANETPEIQLKEELLSLISENDKDKLALKPEELLFIESADNYSNVVFYRNNKIHKQLLRGSLKRLESQISFPYIVRCHRSYIVNLKLIHHIKGNAQGYRIEFKNNLSDTIPVSRNYSKALFERLESLK
jgi:DNA-binding LytR/AlgR family response regulator